MSTDLNPLDEFYFQWHITEKCNKNCRHCYQDGLPTEDLPILDLEEILNQIHIALIKWNKQGSLSFTCW